MNQKRCRGICGRILPLSEFYRHPKMADGHLNHCKRCKTKYAKDRYAEGMQDSSWVDKERRRARSKYHRLYASGRKRVWVEQPPQIKRSARAMLRVAVLSGRIQKPSNCEQCGKAAGGRNLHGHHEDYYRPLDVRWLCAKCHTQEHLSAP